MLILFYLLTCICVLQGKIVIKNAGVATLSRGDVGMIFYVTLHNDGNCKYHVTVKMIKCCETFGKNDMDCQLMNLMGGDMGFLYQNVTKNISLLYPNMYLHNRKGQCMISIKYTSEQKNTVETKQKIPFDTYIIETQVTSALRGYYNMYEYTKCQTVDLDPLDKCQSVNCHMKYLGTRNYFNHKWKRCQKVPLCISDPNKPLPDVSYLPINNKCRDLEAIINVEDLRYLEKGIVEGCWDSQPAPLLSANLRCHHGYLSNETGFCVCDEGWMSAPIDKDQYEPTLSIYHMCNIEISTWNGVNGTKIKMTILIVAMLGAAFAIFTIFLSIVCHLLYKCINSHQFCPAHFCKKRGTSMQTEAEGNESYSPTTSQKSVTPNESTESLKQTTSGTLSSAAMHNSIMIHRKSVCHAHTTDSSDLSLKIIEKKLMPSSVTDTRSSSRNSSGPSSKEKLTSDSENRVILEQTEKFQPSRHSLAEQS